MNVLSISNMADIKAKILADCEINIYCLKENESPFGWFACGDEEDDRKMAQSVIDDYNSGNPWAWCTVQVEIWWAGYPGIANLGMCSYKNEQGFKDSGNYGDMVTDAIYDLLKGMVNNVNKGQESESLLIDTLGVEGLTRRGF